MEEELQNSFQELRARAWSVWEDTHTLVGKAGLDDRMFFAHPIKSPTLEIIDNLEKICNELQLMTDSTAATEPDR